MVLLPSELTRSVRMLRAAVPVALVVTMAVLPQVHATGVSGQGPWETTLQGRDLDGDLTDGFEAYFDTDLNITWLADANYAKTSPYFAYVADGAMSWGLAKTWANQLNINGIAGWRLPDVKPVDGISFQYLGSTAGTTDEGYNITSTQSELAHLYYVTLGNKGVATASGDFQPGFGLSNTGPFSNIQSAYWYGVEYAANTNFAWSFFTDYGGQGNNNKIYMSYAWAVHSGDVAAVPESRTCVLMMLGLVALAAVTSKRLR
jgi:hypothetical protein